MARYRKPVPFSVVKALTAPETLCRQSRQHGVTHHHSTVTAVTGNHHGTAVGHPADRSGERRQKLGFESVTDNSTEARDAEYPGGHLVLTAVCG